MNLRKYLYLLLIVVLIFTACSNEKNVKENKPTYNSKELLAHDIKFNALNSYEFESDYFDLGRLEYLTDYNRVMPFRLRGYMGMPKGEGPFPVVLITHGSHSNENEEIRFDDGYDYVVKTLAQNGIIAISMDMQAPYLWKYGDSDDREKSIYVAKKHLEALIQANNGNESLYSFNLKDKIDFNNIGLIGHSRGGETIFDIANEFLKEDFSVNAILSVAPTMFFTRDWPDNKVAIIVPEYDGDVTQLSGFNIFEGVSENSKEDSIVVFLKYGNHNFFNRKILTNDTVRFRGAEIEKQLSREEQELFFKKFATEFFKESFNKTNNQQIFGLKNQLINSMNGFDVSVKNNTKSSKHIIEIKDSVENIITNGAKIEYLIDSWFYKDDEVTIDTLTIGGIDKDKRPLYRIEWNERGQNITFDLGEIDISKNRAIEIRTVIDALDENNQIEKTQSFSVVLTDIYGNKENVIIPKGINALKASGGFVDYSDILDSKIYFWSRLTPIGGLLLPVGLFSNVELSNIKEISIVFDQTEKGSIYFSEFLIH